MRELPFQQLDRYEILARLSEGAYGEVFAACLRGTADFSTVVAIKVLHASRSTDGGTLQAFAEEARLGGRLIHPNIARVIEFLEADGQLLLVMELVDGVSFVQLVAHQAAAWDIHPAAVLEVVAQACDGLHYAHEARDDAGRLLHLVHRDIKPSNLMLDRAGQVKVMDFGIAKVHLEGRDPTVTGIIKGTPAYMSPEVARGDKRVDRRADIYAMGVVAWELLMGDRMFTGPSFAVLHQVAQGQNQQQLAALRERVPAAVVQVVERALAFDPSARFATCGEMARAARAVARQLGDAVDVRDLAAELAPPPVRISARRGFVAAAPEPVPATGVTQAGASARGQDGVDVAGPEVRAGAVDPQHPLDQAASGPRTTERRWLGVAMGLAVAMAVLVAILLQGQRAPAPAAVTPRPAVAAAPTPSARPPAKPTPPPATAAPLPPDPAVPGPGRRATRAAAAASERPPRPAGALVQLTFATAPEEQPIWIDGRLQDRATPWVGMLPEGAHEITVGAGRKGTTVINLSAGEPQVWLAQIQGGDVSFERVRE